MAQADADAFIEELHSKENSPAVRKQTDVEITVYFKKPHISPGSIAQISRKHGFFPAFPKALEEDSEFDMRVNFLPYQSYFDFEE